MYKIVRTLIATILAVGLVFSAGSALSSDVEQFVVPDPPFSEDFYPCSNCHADMDTNHERRKLEDEHDDIKLVHAQDLRWCLDCHDSDDRDKLKLQNGDRISFYESYRLCGQCHGTIYRDWRAGIHGRRTGYWNGRKEYLLCAHCHDPHQPKYKPLKPEPPPHMPPGSAPARHAEETH